MAVPKREKEVCVNCGADVRPDTQYCYSCGRSVTKIENAKEVPVRTEPIQNESLAELEKALAASRTAEVTKERSMSASVERKRARSVNRKPLEIVWEPAGPNIVYFIAVALLFILAVIIVVVTRGAR